jgi:ABC-type amino acid transport substrate-binding protein
VSRIGARSAAVIASGLLASAAFATSLSAPDATPKPLTVCVAENNPPLSYSAGGELRGLDVRVAQAIAAQLRRPLTLVPFESKLEGESTLAHEVNAMLSSGVCEIASGYPLLASDLGAPTRPTARVPDHPGAKRAPQREWVPLGTLVASRAYHAVALGLLVRDAADARATLADLSARREARIGVIAGTMAGTALTLWRDGRLRPQLVSLSKTQDALEELDAGRIDATLASLDRFDAWRLVHTSSAVRRGAYLHPLRINIGFVTLARIESALVLSAADRVMAATAANGDLQRWSEAAGTTWVPPAEPNVGRAIGLSDLVDR